MKIAIKILIPISILALLLSACTGSTVGTNEATSTPTVSTPKPTVAATPSSTETPLEVLNYQEALALIEQQEYAEAIAKLQELGDYDDSTDLIIECSYLLAQQRLNDDKIGEAISLLRQCSGYKDADDLLLSAYQMSFHPLGNGILDSESTTCLMLASDGTLYGWGDNSNQQLGDFDDIDSSILKTGEVPCVTQPIQITSGVKKVVDGFGSIGLLTQSGDVYLLGARSALGETIPNKDKSLDPSGIIMSGITDIAMGGEILLILNEQGELYSYGRTSADRQQEDWWKTPIEAKKILDGVKSIDALATSFMALSGDNMLYCWGDNHFGQIGNGESGQGLYVNEPTAVLENIIAMKACGGNSLALDRNGDLYIWGWNAFGQIGNGEWGDGDYASQLCVTSPYKVLSNVISADCTTEFTVALTEDGTLYRWGRQHILPMDSDSNVRSFSLGYISEVIVYQDGTTNLNSQNGQIRDVVAICSSNVFSMVLTQSGDLYTAGSNRFGQLGNGEIEDGSNIDLYSATRVMSGIVVN